MYNQYQQPPPYGAPVQQQPYGQYPAQKNMPYGAQQQYPGMQPPPQQYPNQQGQVYNYPSPSVQQQGYGYPAQQGYQQPVYQPSQEKMANDVIAKLKYAIDTYKIDLAQLFCQFDRSADATLNPQEFGELLLKIDPTISASEIYAAFSKFDEMKRNQITFGEFCKNLGKYTDACSQVYDPNSLKKNNQNSESAIEKLKLAIQYYNINLSVLFAKYDTQKNANLNLHEFGTLLRQMEPNLTNYEIDLAFNKFDTDRSGSITFDEFQKALVSFVQAPNPYGYPQQQYPQQGYPPQGQQYPQQNQYPGQPQQGQYPAQYPQQGQYPAQYPQSAQYPGQQPPQSYYPPPPQGQQYPPQGQQYAPQNQYPAQQGYPAQQQYPGMSQSYSYPQQPQQNNYRY